MGMPRALHRAARRRASLGGGGLLARRWRTALADVFHLAAALEDDTLVHRQRGRLDAALHPRWRVQLDHARGFDVALDLPVDDVGAGADLRIHPCAFANHQHVARGDLSRVFAVNADLSLERQLAFELTAL